MAEPNEGVLSQGTVFHGRYEIVRRISSGGMGAIYECIHLKTRKRRALKVMLPQIVASSEMRARFELEARATADVESEHIVETFDAGVDETTGAPYLVMELLRGQDLATLVEKQGPRTSDETVLLLGQAALALDRTHATGIVHRDLKPENLFVTTRDDGSPRLKILDFGIAKVISDSAKSAKQTATIGTPLYMSPEQILGDAAIGPQSDLYALGHIAFSVLTGGPYWGPEAAESPTAVALMMKVVAGSPESATQRAARRGVVLPAAFDAWFSKATARAATDRFDGAASLVAALGRVLDVGAHGARTTEDATRARGPGKDQADLALARTDRATNILDEAEPAPREGPGTSTTGAATRNVQSSQLRRRSPARVGAVAAVLTMIGGLAIVAIRNKPMGLAPRSPGQASASPANSTLETATSNRPVVQTAQADSAKMPSPPSAEAESNDRDESAVPAAVAPTRARSSAPSARVPPKTSEQDAVPESTGTEFDPVAAAAALDKAAAAVAHCWDGDGPMGSGRVRVTFAPTGLVTTVIIEGPPFAGTSVGLCISATFRATRIPAFDGVPVTVHKIFSINLAPDSPRQTPKEKPRPVAPAITGKITF